jgi:hypothetical protein
VKLVVAAPLTLWPIPDVVSKMAALMVSLPDETEVWVRGISPVEKAATIMAEELGFMTIWLPPRYGPSRDTIFARDYDLVKGADLVVGFFLDEDDDPLGGGTGHVVHAAMQKGIPCEAWLWTRDGLINVGSDDGDIVHYYDPGFYPVDRYTPGDEMAGRDVSGVAW